MQCIYFFPQELPSHSMYDFLLIESITIDLLEGNKQSIKIDLGYLSATCFIDKVKSTLMENTEGKDNYIPESTYSVVYQVCRLIIPISYLNYKMPKASQKKQ